MVYIYRSWQKIISIINLIIIYIINNWLLVDNKFSDIEFLPVQYCKNKRYLLCLWVIRKMAFVKLQTCLSYIIARLLHPHANLSQLFLLLEIFTEQYFDVFIFNFTSNFIILCCSVLKHNCSSYFGVGVGLNQTWW